MTARSLDRPSSILIPFVPRTNERTNADQPMMALIEEVGQRDRLDRRCQSIQCGGGSSRKDGERGVSHSNAQPHARTHGA